MGGPSPMSGVPATSGESPPDEAPFRADLQVRRTPGTAPGQAAVVSITGDLDMHTQTQLADALTAAMTAPVRRIVLDLSAVDFMASAGVHVLLEAAGQFRTAGGILLVAGARPMVARVMSLTGADELVPMAVTVDEALAG